jgi:hypothetical protein
VYSNSYRVLPSSKSARSLTLRDLLNPLYCGQESLRCEMFPLGRFVSRPQVDCKKGTEPLFRAITFPLRMNHLHLKPIHSLTHGHKFCALRRASPAR